MLISNVGGPTSGVRYTDEITTLLQPTLTRLGLEIHPVKRDALEAADQQGNAFMSLFTTFGSFSIFAGFLLIFLIFVMLAAERRGELGIARAVGTRRGHLIQMYLYEGLAYDLLAAAVGAAVGVAVAFGMVFILGERARHGGVTIEHDVQWQSIVVAYAVGVLLTFVVVGLSAWRVSRLNIVTRRPEPARAAGAEAAQAPVDRRARCDGRSAPCSRSRAWPLRRRCRSSSASRSSRSARCPVVQALGVPQRIAYTAAGLGIVVVCLLPFDWLDALAGTDLRMNFSVWIVSRDPDRARRLVGDRLQRGRPARARDGVARAHSRADADPAPFDRVPAAEPLPHRRDARDVHARRLHARRGRHDLRLVRARVRRRGDRSAAASTSAPARRRSARSTTRRARSRTRRAFGPRTSASSPRSRTCR